MKLRNKLIPLMSVIAATGCAAPIASSCSTGNLRLTDITKNYQPTIAKAERKETAITEENANDLYFSHVQENPEILVQDVLAYEAAKLPERIENIEYYDFYNNGHSTDDTQYFICSNVKANVGVSNISVKKLKTADEDEKVFYAVSCRLDYVFGYTATSMDGTYSMTYQNTLSAAMTDIPTYVYAANIYNPRADVLVKRWKVTNAFDNKAYLKAAPSWNYTFTQQEDLSETYIDEQGSKQNRKNSNSRDGTINRISQLEGLSSSDTKDMTLFFESYHLSDISAGEAEKGGIPMTADGKVNTSITMASSKTWGTLATSLSIPFMKLTTEDAALFENTTDYRFYIGKYAPSEEDYNNAYGSTNCGTRNTCSAFEKDTGCILGIDGGLSPLCLHRPVSTDAGYDRHELWCINRAGQRFVKIVDGVVYTCQSNSNTPIYFGQSAWYLSEQSYVPMWINTGASVSFSVSSGYTSHFHFINPDDGDDMVVGFAGYDQNGEYFSQDYEIEEDVSYVGLDVTFN